MVYTNEGAKPAPAVKESGPPPMRAVWGIGYVKRKLQERAAKYKDETPTDRAARRTATATIWMAAFTCILTVTSGLTIWILKNQLMEIHGGGIQTDKIITADERVATAMEGSVKQAQTIFDAANKQAAITQRAWMSVAIGLNLPKDQQPFEVGKPFDIRVSFKNTGRTPALNVKTFTAKTVRPKVDGQKVEPPSFKFDRKSFVFGGNVTPDGVLFQDFPPVPLTDEDKERIVAPRVAIFVYGRVEYDDVFGAHHWNNYCGVLTTGGAFTFCGYHNDMDKN